MLNVNWMYVSITRRVTHAYFILYSDLKCVTCCQLTPVQKTPQNPHLEWRWCHNAKNSFVPDFVFLVQSAIVSSRQKTPTVSFVFTLIVMLILLCLFRLHVYRLSQSVMRVKCCLHLHPTWRWRQQFTTEGGNRASQCAVTKTCRTFRLRRCEPACTSSEPA